MGHYRPGMKRNRSGNGNDFRWKKAKQERKRELEMREMLSGDALDDDLPTNNPSPAANTQKKETSKEIKSRQKEAKKRRREHHEREREESDALIRSAPHDYLWSRYTEWAGDKLTSVELAAERWGAEHVAVLEDSGGSLMPDVKAILGDDYREKGEYQGGTPGVAVIALAASALNAVNFAKRMYDGAPVGKLFSKHIKIQGQKEWLSKCCSKGLAASAAGTAKRVQRLVEDGDMTLNHTVGLVIDMSRDMRLLNIIDMDSTREELFEFLHQHVRPLIAEGKTKVILCIPKMQVTKLEDVKEELMTRMNKAKKRRKLGKQKQKHEAGADS